MKIGIIGAGHIGSALATRFTVAGHDVVIANSRGPESLGDIARQTGAQAVTVEQAAEGRDVVVITIPFKHVAELPKDLFQGAPETLVVVDTNNYYPQQRDGAVAEVESGMTESAWVAQQLGRSVIKVFNNIYAEHLLNNGKPRGTPGRIALPVAGDDGKAKQTVMHLVDEIGFDPVDAGSLSESWRQQPGSPVYTKDFDRAGVEHALQEARPERTPQWRATPNSPGTYEQPK